MDKPVDRAPSGYPGRVALFACAFDKKNASELLTGFCDGTAAVALAHAERLMAMPRGARQAELIVRFGERSDAATALGQLIVEAPSRLSQAMSQLLPSYFQNVFPAQTRQAASPASNHVLSVARRLAREATR